MQVAQGRGLDFDHAATGCPAAAQGCHQDADSPMKTPTVSPLPPTPPAARAALAVGQVLPARVLSPAEAKELVAQAKEAVVETTLGLARARPLPPPAAPGTTPRPSAPGARPPPSAPGSAAVPATAALLPSRAAPSLEPLPGPAAAPNPHSHGRAAAPTPAPPAERVQLQVLSLNPLRVRVLPPDTPVPARGRLPVPAELPPDQAVLELDWLPPRRAQAPEMPARSPEPAAAAARAKPPGPGTSASAPESLPPARPGGLPAPPRAAIPPEPPLQAEAHALLRRLLPRQQPLAEALPALARLLPRLLRTSTPQSGRPAHPALALAGPLLREALQSLPTPRALAEPERLATVLRLLMTGRAPLPPAPKPETLPEARAPEHGEAPPTPKRASAPPNPPDWPGLARALRVLVQAMRLPPPSPPSSVPTPAPSPAAAAAAEPPRTPGIEPVLRQLLQLFRPVDAEASPEPELRTASGEPPEARPADAPSRPPVPAETVALEQALTLTERLAARSQVQLMQHAGPPQPGGTVWQLELPVRDGRDLDFVEFRVEEREADDTGSETAGAKPWSLSLRFDFPGLGPFRAVVHWHQARIATRLFAERPETVALINGELPRLATALQAAGLDAQVHACERAALKAGRVQQAQGLLDLRI